MQFCCRCLLMPIKWIWFLWKRIDMERYLNDIAIAFEAIQANKIKSVLTGLGIIFGVAAVISMLAIGNGAKQEIIEQIKLVGVNNIIVKPIIKKASDNSEDDDGKKQSNKYSTG